MAAEEFLSLKDYLAEVDLSQVDDVFESVHALYLHTLHIGRIKGKISVEAGRLAALKWSIGYYNDNGVSSIYAEDFMMKTSLEEAYPGGYANVTLFTCSDSNLETHQISVSVLPVYSDGKYVRQTMYRMDVLTEEESDRILSEIKEMYELSKESLDNLGFKMRDPHADRDLYVETTMLPTNDDWYPSHEVDGLQMVEASISKIPSNLDLWTIQLSGDDDFSMSTDILGESEAKAVWQDLLSRPAVNHTGDLENFYFSN